MYFSLEDLQTEFGNRGPQGFGESDYTAVHDRTAHLVESYLRSAGLEVPVTDPEALAVLKGPAIDIAIYYAWPKPSEQVQNRHKEAVAWLTNVSTGKVRIKTATQESRKAGFHSIRIIRS